MQLTCDRALFSAAFQTAASAVPARTPKDVLRNVYMHLGTGGVEVVGTDQEVAIRYKVDGVTTTSTGEALLPTARVSPILRELQDEQFEIVVEEQSLMIKAASSQFRLSSEDPRDFPPVPEFDATDYYRIPANVFRQIIRRTSFATDVESTRYALGGLLLEFDEGKVTVAATDSRRLAVATAACETEGSPKAPEKTTVVPTRAMALLERSIDGSEEFVDVAVRENDVLMRSGRCVIYSRLVEGRFPKYRDVIPQSGSISIMQTAGPFHAAVRQAQIVTDEESRGVDFTFDKAKLTMSSRAQDIGESKIELPIEYDHEEIKITFDPRYVADFLKVLTPETLVELQLISAEHAAVFRVEDSYTYVIMPLSQSR
ncbi:DNA polymerase III subunit beta [Fuerstiella marisgermanici]|uniref:Beta sliding clamp n=1 Tax=Fuerstiella marisgermanici TaxID=1891926 RepID=A0A1P8WML5_9PLAN|nr:DNA polymerase III subunit beta [Fuerstiella marisgermanici]APZ95300.1 DNA polymerase III subunit beta [Fuerstiella marisgermanici]